MYAELTVLADLAVRFGGRIISTDNLDKDALAEATATGHVARISRTDDRTVVWLSEDLDDSGRAKIVPQTAPAPVESMSVGTTEPSFAHHKAPKGGKGHER
jgi:hypothetical protein